MIIIYLFDNVIQYKEKEEIKEFTMPKNAMKYGKIKNIPIFEKELDKLIKKEKWGILFRSKTIHIILPVHYDEIDKEILTVLFNNNGIKNIKYTKEINLFDLKKNQIIINIHSAYLTTVEKRKKNIAIYFYPFNIFDSLENTLSFIFNKYSKKIRYILLGSNENIPKIAKKSNNKQLFYYQEYKRYIVKKYIP